MRHTVRRQAAHAQSLRRTCCFKEGACRRERHRCCHIRGCCAQPVRARRRIEAERDPAVDRQQGDIGAFGGDGDGAAAVEQQAEFSRQGAQPFVAGKAFGDGARDRADVELLGGIQPGQRRDHEIARGFGLGVGIDQAELAKLRMELGHALV